MNDPIEIRYRWTADELIAGMRAHLRTRYSLLIRLLFFSFTTILFLSGITSLVCSGLTADGIIPTVVGTCLFLMFSVIQPFILRRHFAKRPDRDTDVAWSISADRITSKYAHGNSEFTWPALAKVVQTKDGFLFYPNAQIFHWLPRHGFASEADFQRVSDLAGSNALVFVHKG